MSNASRTSESLVSRRALVAVGCLVAALLPPHESAAQFTSALDLSSRNAKPSAGEWRNQLAVSPFARFDHRRVAIDGSWTALGGEGQRLNGFGNLGATYFSPVRRGVQLSAAGFADRSLLGETFAVSSLGADARLSYRTGRSGTWLGREVMRDNKRTTVSPVPELSAGAWHQWRNAVVTFSLSAFGSREGGRAARTWQEFRPVVKPPPAPGVADTGRTIDTLTFGDSGSTGNRRNWNDAEVALHWNAGPLALRGVIGSRFLTTRQPNEMWGQLQGSYSLAPEVALIAATGVRARNAAYGVDRGRFLELGLRVAPIVLRQPRLPTGVRPVATVFSIEGRTPAHRTVRIRVPSARTVELSGDFTSWKPISLVRVDDDHWEARLPIAAGMHRLAIRVDGEKWTPPPGVASVADEFQGNVGVVVIK